MFKSFRNPEHSPEDFALVGKEIVKRYPKSDEQVQSVIDAFGTSRWRRVQRIGMAALRDIETDFEIANTATLDSTANLAIVDANVAQIDEIEADVARIATY